jgi:hypothetical protein
LCRRDPETTKQKQKCEYQSHLAHMFLLMVGGLFLPDPLPASCRLKPTLSQEVFVNSICQFEVTSEMSRF